MEEAHVAEAFGAEPPLPRPVLLWRWMALGCGACGEELSFNFSFLDQDRCRLVGPSLARPCSSTHCVDNFH